MKKPRRWSYPTRIRSREEGNASLEAAIKSERPFFAGRFGSVELNCLERFLRISNGQKRYDAKLKHDMSNNAGFYPTEDVFLDAFSKEYGNASADLDVLGVWFNPYEDLAVRRFCPRAVLVPLRSLEPYYFNVPWSRVLERKRVLVIHPFAFSIQKSYLEARTHLFENPAVLPSFQLLTLKAVQSNAGSSPGFVSWFEALGSMKAQMKAMEFDICIVGAGAYGLPLGAYAKSLGRQAIHMGGATQVLFGIIGRRWEQHPIIKNFINSSWRRPTAEETPSGAHLVENGCYW